MKCSFILFHATLAIFELLRDENRPHPKRRKEAGLLGLTESRLGQTWSSLTLSWAEQEPTWVQIGRNLRRTRASWLQFEPNWGPTRLSLGTFGRKVGPKTGPMWATWPCTNPDQSQKTLEMAVKMQVFSMSH